MKTVRQFSRVGPYRHGYEAFVSQEIPPLDPTADEWRMRELMIGPTVVVVGTIVVASILIGAALDWFRSVAPGRALWRHK